MLTNGFQPLLAFLLVPFFWLVRNPDAGLRAAVLLGALADVATIALLARLGKHRMGKGCVYFRRIADLDPQALEALIAGSVAELRRRYPAKAGA